MYFCRSKRNKTDTISCKCLFGAKSNQVTAGIDCLEPLSLIGIDPNTGPTRPSDVIVHLSGVEWEVSLVIP